MQTHEDYPLVTGADPGVNTNKVRNYLPAATHSARLGLQFTLDSSMLSSWQQCWAHADQTGPCLVQVHVFAEQWALQGDGYEPVTFSKPRYSTLFTPVPCQHNYASNMLESAGYLQVVVQVNFLYTGCSCPLSIIVCECCHTYSATLIVG